MLNIDTIQMWEKEVKPFLNEVASSTSDAEMDKTIEKLLNNVNSDIYSKNYLPERFDPLIGITKPGGSYYYNVHANSTKKEINQLESLHEKLVTFSRVMKNEMNEQQEENIVIKERIKNQDITVEEIYSTDTKIKGRL